jgi:hypothetical protein
LYQLWIILDHARLAPDLDPLAVRIPALCCRRALSIGYCAGLSAAEVLGIVMDLETIIREYYASLSRDLSAYIAVLAAVTGAAGVGWASSRQPIWWAFALSLCALLVLFGSAASYVLIGISARQEAELVALLHESASARATALERYSAEAAWLRFRNMLAIWSITTIAAGVALLARQPVVTGCALALILVSFLSCILDASAWRREVITGEHWMKNNAS